VLIRWSLGCLDDSFSAIYSAELVVIMLLQPEQTKPWRGRQVLEDPSFFVMPANIASTIGLWYRMPFGLGLLQLSGGSHISW